MDTINTSWEKGKYNAISNPSKYVTIEHMKNMQTYWEEVLRKVESFPNQELTEEEMLNKRIYSFIVKERIDQLRKESYLIPLNAEGGFFTGFAFTPRYTNFQSQESYEEYISKLDSFPVLVDQQITMMELGLAKGKTLSSVILDGYEGLIEAYMNEDISKSPFIRPFDENKNNLADSVWQRLLVDGRHAVSGALIPAYKKLYTFFKEEYIPKARNTVGMTAMPEGGDWYEQRVKFFSTLDYSSDEIFNIGIAEVKRIRSEMEEIIERTGFEGSFEDFLEFLRTDPQFYAKTPGALLREATFLSKKIEGKLPRYFGKIPRNPFTVEPVPDEIAPRYTGGRYVPGSYEHQKAGTYWVNTYDLKSRPLYVLPALTLHEAVPGHHLQGSLTQELANVPPFRNETYLSCYGEGWALYTEYLGKEMGIYETDYQDFGRLTYEMWRACRLVVDVALHAKDWSREKAVDFMASNTALSMHEVNTEINRYIGWPAQALSYKIGELKIRELRTRAEEKLGDKFDIRSFHDLILAQGAMPLFILEEMVDEWIEEESV